VGTLGKARRVRIYLNEGDRTGRGPAHLAILALLREENAQGATALLGVEGFGASGTLHTSLLVDVARDLPMVIEWIDRPEVVDRLLGRVKALAPRALVTVDETEVVQFDPHPVRDVSDVLTAGDVMTREVVSVSPRAPLREVVELMLGKVYRALPVVDGGRPVGIITNGDLVRKGGLDVRLDLLPALETSQRDAVLERLSKVARSAADVMTSPPVVVASGTPLPQVAEAMARRRLKRLPVVGAQGALVGMVSRVDLLRTAAGGFAAAEPATRERGLRVEGPIGRVARQDVPTVHPDTPLPEVFQAVVSTRLNRALVVDADRRVVGLVTDAEMLERITPSMRPGALRSLMSRLPFASADAKTTEKHTHARTAADLMSTNVPTVREDAPVAEATATMLRGNHKLIAVVDASSRLVGIVDRADLLHGIVGPA